MKRTISGRKTTRSLNFHGNVKPNPGDIQIHRPIRYGLSKSLWAVAAHRSPPNEQEGEVFDTATYNGSSRSKTTGKWR